MVGRGKVTTVAIPKDILHKMKGFARFNKVLRSAIKLCATTQKFCATENGLILRIFDEKLREKSFYFANNKCAIGPP
jgi:hypothetical protein